MLYLANYQIVIRNSAENPQEVYLKHDFLKEHLRRHNFKK